MKRIVACLLLLLTLPAFAGDFTFIHVSDMHVGAGNNAATDTAMLKEISKLNPKPAFIAGTGDLCEIGTEPQYASYREIVGEFPSLILHQAPGNHDVRWNPLGKEGFTKGSGQPMYQSWSHEGIHFVLLDSTTLLQHWGHFDADMLAWLKKDLTAWGTEKPVIIGFHHPIAHGGITADNEQELMDLVAPFNVRLWLQGHGHSNVQWNINGVPAIMVQGLYQGAYNIVEIKGDTLHVSRRFLKPAKKGEELVDAKPEVMHADILTVSLKKPIAPDWKASFEPNRVVKVFPADMPADTTYAMRVDQGKYEPMNAEGGGWIAVASPKLAGDHVVTAQATLKDGRVYQIPLKMNLGLSEAPKPTWEKNVGGAVMSRLVRDGDTLYVPSMGNDLVAMDAKSGNEKWRVKTGGGIFSTPHIDNGVVYFGSADHNIYAADVKSGEVKWKTPTGGAVFGGASVAKGIACIASCDRKIYGLDINTGEEKWSVTTGGMTQSKVATDGNLFFVGTWDNQFRAIDAASGDVKWSHKFGKKGDRIIFYFAPAIGSPTVGGGKVFVSSNDGLLHAIDIKSGEIAWETPKSRSLGYSGPLFHDGKIYEASLSGMVYCFDANNGDELWKRDTGSAIYDSSCALGGGNVYVGCVDGTFSAITLGGEIKWQYMLGPGHVLASPATDDAKVYISSMSGKVTALPLN